MRGRALSSKSASRYGRAGKSERSIRASGSIASPPGTTAIIVGANKHGCAVKAGEKASAESIVRSALELFVFMSSFLHAQL
jgi:hypothetical protein